MLRFGRSKVAKEKFQGAKKLIKSWDVNVDNIVTSKLVKTKSNFKYLVGYLDEVIRPLNFLQPEMNGQLKHSKIKVEIIIN